MFWLYETKYVLLQPDIWNGILQSSCIIITLHSILFIFHLQMEKLKPKKLSDCLKVLAL